MSNLLDHPFIVVMGKGGVGRTTVAAALGRAAAALGKRACVCELGELAALPPKFGLEGRTFAFRRGAPGVDVWSLTVPEALEEFGARKLHLPGFARRVVRNRFVAAFVDAIPGLHDLLLLGKIENMISEPRSGDPVYDTVILDAPATGHGITLLTAARTLTEITRAGPFFELAKAIEVFLSDPKRTALVLTTLPELLPIRETLELAQQLENEGFRPNHVVVNQVEPSFLPPSIRRQEVEDALQGLAHGVALLGLATQAWDRQDSQRDALQEITAGAARHGLPSPLRAPWVDVVADETAMSRSLGQILAQALA